jgi:WD repeat and SOF domain-containing protein 1
VPRNYDATLHPLQAPREYVRALNAVKLERVFAKPFLGSLDGHRDGISVLCKHPQRLSVMLSAACDGEIRLWELPKRKCLKTISAHDGYVRGLCFNQSGEYFFSCGDDMTIKQWRCSASEDDETVEVLMNTILGKTVFHSIDHHWSTNMFATCGQQVDIWDEERSEPVRSFSWGLDSLNSIKFNPIETHLLGATASDRNVLLYDTRGSAPLRKVTLQNRSNAIAWNPMEAYTFTVANEDYNLYTFDLRNLSRAACVHMDHVLSVLDVDYSPTGREFVSGSYDKTVRIFPVNRGHSREVYHTKRMQRVLAVKWSLDNKFILSGSEEMNLRVWKASASAKLGVLCPREKEAFNYSETLKDKFAHHPDIRRIARHRHVPKLIHNAAKELRAIHSSQKKKEANRRAHSKPGAVPFVAERVKNIVGEVE